MTEKEHKELMIIKIALETKDFLYLKKYGFLIERNIQEYLKDIIKEMKRLNNK